MSEAKLKNCTISKHLIREELSKIEAADIMVPRSEVVLINYDSQFIDIVETIIKDGHSRFPVYSEKIDNIVGILYAKSLLSYYKDNSNIEFDINKVLRKPLFVSENKKASDLLTEFRNTHTHLAIVVNEYGTMLGIITLEDVLEEIVGEISDEFDKAQTANYTTLNDTDKLVLPRMSIDEFNQVFNTRIKSEDFETIGGFLVDQFGYVPTAGEELIYRNYKMIVNQVEGSRIINILVKRV